MTAVGRFESFAVPKIAFCEWLLAANNRILDTFYGE